MLHTCVSNVTAGAICEDTGLRTQSYEPYAQKGCAAVRPALAAGWRLLHFLRLLSLGEREYTEYSLPPKVTLISIQYGYGVTKAFFSPPHTLSLTRHTTQPTAHGAHPDPYSLYNYTVHCKGSHFRARLRPFAIHPTNSLRRARRAPPHTHLPHAVPHAYCPIPTPAERPQPFAIWPRFGRRRGAASLSADPHEYGIEMLLWIHVIIKLYYFS